METEAEQSYVKGKNPLLSFFHLPDSYGNVCVVYLYRCVSPTGTLKPER